MIRAALDHCGKDMPALLVTKYGHLDKGLDVYRNLSVIESAHPVPDSNSLRAGEALLEFVSGLSKDAVLLLLVSGGASALAEALPADYSLDDLQAMNRKMLADGLDIHAINTKRKQISQIKAGKLLGRFKGGQARVFAISDVEGDSISVIGSGIGALPAIALCEDMKTQIIASNAIAREACEQAADNAGLDVIVSSENLYGDIMKVAADCANTVLQGGVGIYVFGGEPTTTLPDNPGEGGRNQALAVAMAREISGAENIFGLVAGTDGSDGPTKSAGGFFDRLNFKRVPGGEEALQAANTGQWLRRADALFVSGPTGTNVMDLMIVLKR
jgi:hydroxypyruvate reductase